MSVLTGIVEAEILDRRNTVTGKVVSRPRLSVFDPPDDFQTGVNFTYGVDVDIGVQQIDPSGAVDQDSPGLELRDPQATILRNVPIASGSLDLRYAETGNPVTLTRSPSGKWFVTGFAKELPGTYTRVGVAINDDFDFGVPEYTIGAPERLDVQARALTYGELTTIGGGYGTAAYGSSALFRGDELIEVI